MAAKEKYHSEAVKQATGPTLKTEREWHEQRLQEVRELRRQKWTPHRQALRATRRLETARAGTARAEAQLAKLEQALEEQETALEKARQAVAEGKEKLAQAREAERERLQEREKWPAEQQEARAVEAPTAGSDHQQLLDLMAKVTQKMDDQKGNVQLEQAFAQVQQAIQQAKAKDEAEAALALAASTSTALVAGGAELGAGPAEPEEEADAAMGVPAEDDPDALQQWFRDQEAWQQAMLRANEEHAKQQQQLQDSWVALQALQGTAPPEEESEEQAAKRHKATKQALETYQEQQKTLRQKAQQRTSALRGKGPGTGKVKQQVKILDTKGKA